MDSLIPVIIEGEFFDGSVFGAAEKCKQKYKAEACKLFYERLKSKEEGFYECPSGYTIYLKKYDEMNCFYMGIRVKKHCRKVTTKVEDNTKYLIPEFLFFNILSSQEKLVELQNNMERQKSIHKDLLHDVRKLDSHIMYKSDEIVREYSEKGKDYKDIVNRVRNINAMEQLIACKYSVYDLVSNIQVLSIGSFANVNVYKKFDKIRYILTGYKNKNVIICFTGETSYQYNMSTAYSEILPFLLLENAVKYTIGKNSVDVQFEEVNDTLVVTVESFGPYCEEDELDKIFIKNYRGRNTVKHNSDGTGVGMYLVNEICNICNIDIRVSSDYIKNVNGLRCGLFKVELIF